MLINKVLITWILFCTLSQLGCSSFVVRSSNFHHVASSRTSDNDSFFSIPSQRPSFISYKSSSTSLNEYKSRKSVQGLETRGPVLFAISLLVCAWLFTIPVEFRRARFCASDYCVENRDECNRCMTVDEWKTGIADYYRNGGGIKWDFSVADDTKKFWKDAVGVEDK